jgi:hypothetical protein
MNSTIRNCNNYGSSNSNIQLIVTGIDSVQEFQHKYRNSAHVIRELQRLNHNHKTKKKKDAQQSSSFVSSGLTTPTTTSSNSNNNILNVEIQHGINAILVPPQDDTNTVSLSSSSAPAPLPPQRLLPTTNKSAAGGHYNVILIFHHPHLGIEDATLHSKFMHHLFYSVYHYWLAQPATMNVDSDEQEETTKRCGGIFHLTLVNGQYELWSCHQAAQKYNMTLIQQSKFIPHPTPTTATKSPSNSAAVPTLQYGHRRHQSGKSFASRATNGSTTYTFMRSDDGSKQGDGNIGTNDDSDALKFCLRLPWFENITNHSNSTQQSLFIAVHSPCIHIYIYIYIWLRSIIFLNLRIWWKEIL